MAAEDARTRAELAADGSLFQGYNPRMQEVHDHNAARLAQILADHGWPGERQVGVEGARAAWLIVQHGIAQPAFQRQALAMMSAAAERGEEPSSVDERRTAVGLRPLAEEIAAQRQAAAEIGDHPPADWEARRREMETWLRQVGWRPAPG